METETLQQQPPEKLRKIYNYLKGQNKVRSETYEDFEAKMEDPARLEKVYNYLKGENKVGAESFDVFQEKIGLKKKEQGLPGHIPLAPEADPETLQIPGTPEPLPLLESGLTEEQERERNLAELSKAPVNSDQPTTRDKAVIDDSVRDFIIETEKRVHPENYREDNPLVSFGKSLWNVLANQIPSAIASTMALVSKTPASFKVPEEFQSHSKIHQKKWLEYAQKQQQEGGELTKDLVNTMDKVKDPIDALNYTFAAAGQATGQIPLSVVTGGASSAVQEIGSVYLGSVQKIAKEKGISVNDVIDQGLDETAYALTYGLAAGMLDRVGARAVMGTFSKQAFKQSLRDRAKLIATSTSIEGGTEYVQTGLEQLGIGQGAGQSFSQALEEAVTNPEMRKERLEGLVQGLIGGTTLSSAGVAFNAMREARTPDTLNEEQHDTTQPISSAPDATAGQQTPGDKTEPVQQSGPGQDLNGLKRSIQTAPVQEQQPADDQANVENAAQTTDTGTAGPPVSSPAEQRADISTEERRDIPAPETEVSDGGGVDQAPDSPSEIGDITDPDELAGLYMEEVNNPSVSRVDVSIASILGQTKVNRASFTENNDATNITPGMAKSYFDKKGKGSPLDVVAKQASELLNPLGDGTDISPEDVANFMIRYKSGPNTITTPSGNPRLADIANQYSTITGKGINRKTAGDLLTKAAARAQNAKANREVFSESFMLVAEMAEKPGSIDFSDTDTRSKLMSLYGLSEEEYVFLSNFYGEANQQTTDQGGVERRERLVPDAQSQETAVREGAEVSQRPGSTPESDQETLIREIKDKTLTHVHGLNMGSGVAKGTYLSTEEQNRYATPGQEISSAEVDITSPIQYTSDDDIISLRNNILKDKLENFDVTDFVALEKPDIFEVTIDFLSDSGINKLAEMVRDELIAQGHDSIYFPESSTQEGELIVFDRAKVKLTPQTNDSTPTDPPVQPDAPDTPEVPRVDEDLQTDEEAAEPVQQDDGPFPIGTEVEFDWHDGRRLIGKVERYAHGRVHIRTDAGTSYPMSPMNVNRVGVTAKKAAPKDAEKTVKHNSKRKRPIGIVGHPGSGFMFITDLGDKIAGFFKKQFTSKGFLPQYVFNRWIGAKGEINVYENQIRFTVKDFKDAIKKDYDGKLTDEQITDLNLYLQGKQPTNPIPPETTKILDVMRAQIDNLSRRFIDEGIISGDLQATFTDNLGVYLNRSYRKFDDPFWAEFVPAEVRNKAEAFIRNNAAAKGQVITDEEVQGLINYILYDPKAPMAVLAGSKLGSKDLSILKKRGDIAPEIRALMGEYSDPLLNYQRSVTKMINLIAKHHFLNAVKANGTGTFLFDKPTGKYHVKLAADASKTMAPLNGMYTSPEIAEAFNEFNSHEPMPPWLKVYMKGISIVKANKTVFSVQTHARNIVGNLGFVVMNGHWRVNNAGKGVQTAWAHLYDSDQKIRDKYLEYVQLGIVQDSAAGGELRQYVKDIRDGKDFFETLGERTLAKASRKILDVTQHAYQAEDDMFKIYAYENEFARYRKAYPNKPVEEVRRMAADIVRDTYPTYSMVPKIVKGLRANPLVGTFVSFPAEVFRTTYNTMQLAQREMANPETRDIGVQRTAGILSALLIPTAASMYTLYALGMDGEDDDDIRKFAAPWQKDSEFLYLKNDKDKYTIIDLGYSDPHNYLKRPIYQFLSEGPLLENGIDAAQALARPFVDENMLTERLIDIHRNKKATGDHVYNPDAPVGDQLSAVYSHLWPVTEPGTIASLRRIRKGMLGETDKYGKEYDAAGEIMSVVTGQKEETKDITQALLYRAYELKDRIEATEKDYFRIIKNMEATPEQKADAERVRKEATDKILTDAKDIYMSAIRLGVDPKVARRYMILTRNEQIFRATAGAK